jgi:hypothetical protein
MIKITSSGNFDRTNKFLDSMIHGDITSELDRAAQQGVNALQQATPRESGVTADSWSYEITKTGSATTIWFINSHVVNGFNVAVGLQYGHGTGTGGWIAGYDYINPALKPIFDQIADNVWKEVQRA